MNKQYNEELKRIFNARQVVQSYFAIPVVVLIETIGLWLVGNKLVIPVICMGTV